MLVMRTVPAKLVKRFSSLAGNRDKRHRREKRQANIFGEQANIGELCSGMSGEHFRRTTNLFFRKVRLYANVCIRFPAQRRGSGKPTTADPTTAKLFFGHRFQPGDVVHLQSCVTQHLQARTGSFSLNRRLKVDARAAALHA
jgi:hypothetical protein